MFASWFASQKGKKMHQSITRVQNMLLEPPRIAAKYISPTLQQLQSGKFVKKMSSNYEETIVDENNKLAANCFELKTPLTTRKVLLHKNVNGIVKIVKCLLYKEKSYIQTMEKLLNAYVFELDFQKRYMTEAEREDLITSVFGYIKPIYEMHSQTFLPFIESSIRAAEKPNFSISTFLLDFGTELKNLCGNDVFSPYVMHAKTEMSSKIKREKSFSQLMVYCEQKYQFPYSFNPCSQINHYGEIFEDMLKEAQKETISKDCLDVFSSAVQEFNNVLSIIKLD